LQKPDYLALLKPHYSDAVNYCRALCAGKSRVEAEDIFQEAMLKAYEKRGSLKDLNKFRSWLFKIITNCFRNSCRSSFFDRFSLFDSNDIDNQFRVFNDHFFQENQLIIGALSKIGEKERVALLLFELGGFSIKEIKIIQQENSESTIKSRLSRTRDKLREIIEELEENNKTACIQGSITPKTITDLYDETYKIIKKIKPEV